MDEGTRLGPVHADGRCDTEERMPRMEERPEFIEINVSDTLAKSDYDQLVPRLATQRGRLRMLIRLSDFSGWTPSALWADLRFDPPIRTTWRGSRFWASRSLTGG